MELAQTLIKDILEYCEHEISHCCSINVELHQNVQDFLMFADWFLFVNGGHVLCYRFGGSLSNVLGAEICEAYVSLFNMCWNYAKPSLVEISR